LPLTDATVLEYYDYLFAPWVKQLGLREFKVAPGVVSAVLPQNDALKFASGAICGQVIMAAIDTVASLAMSTNDRVPKGTEPARVCRRLQLLREWSHDERIDTSEILAGGT
jgi:acyl-coenzyme A thioesterase PaaI-like protein